MGKTLNAVGKLKQRKATRIYNAFAADYFREVLKVGEYLTECMEAATHQEMQFFRTFPSAAIKIEVTLENVEEAALKALEEK